MAKNATKITKKRKQPEQAEQILLCSWFAKKYPEIDSIFFHISNGTHVGAYRGSILKKMGVKPGIPDIFLAVPRYEKRETFHGLFIEMKSKTGKISPAQKLSHEKLREKNYKVEVCWSFMQARVIIQTYLE